MFQDSLGWALAVIHNHAIPAYTAFHTALQRGQIVSALFSGTIGTRGDLPFYLPSRKPSTEAWELQGNLSTVLYSTPLQSSLFTHTEPRTNLTDQYLQWWSASYSAECPRVHCWVCGIFFKLCNHRNMHAQRQEYKLPFSCFHHSLLKHKRNCRQSHKFKLLEDSIFKNLWAS